MSTENLNLLKVTQNCITFILNSRHIVVHTTRSMKKKNHFLKRFQITVDDDDD
jgi:hypothetical protein